MVNLPKEPDRGLKNWEDWQRKMSSAKRDLNPQPLGYEACALPLCQNRSPSLKPVWNLIFESQTSKLNFVSLQRQSFAIIFQFSSNFLWSNQVQSFRRRLSVSEVGAVGGSRSNFNSFFRKARFHPAWKFSPDLSSVTSWLAAFNAAG